MQLEARGLSHAYGATPALADIDLTVRSGEIVCLIGPSGCGKSTLLRILGGLQRPSAGQVWQYGEPPPGCLNPLTFIFQDFALLPWRTAAGNVSLVLEGHKLSSAARRRVIDQVLARTKLSEFAEAYPAQLSGGMRQRVGIARALAVNPAVLLMDEPLSALDAQTRELLLDDIVALWSKERFTAVYVTHNLSEAVRLAHRVVVLSRRPGRVKAVVTVDPPPDRRQANDPRLHDLHQQLWASIRAEAADAERELSHARG